MNQKVQKEIWLGEDNIGVKHIQGFLWFLYGLNRRLVTCTSHWSPHSHSWLNKLCKTDDRIAAIQTDFSPGLYCKDSPPYWSEGNCHLNFVLVKSIFLEFVIITFIFGTSLYEF